MIKIRPPKGKIFDELAEQHWENLLGIKPDSKKKEFLKFYPTSKSIIHNLKVLYESDTHVAKLIDDISPDVEFDKLKMEDLNDSLLHKIIVSKPHRLKAIIRFVERNYNLYIKTKESLVKIFNYKTFSEYKKNSWVKWDGYRFTQALGVSVCPYCNRQYVTTLEKTFKDDGKVASRGTRPELDHHLPQNKYPLLALSFYNLIPSCHVCNSNLKGDLNLYNNPYIDDIDKKLKFHFSPKKLKNNTFNFKAYLGDTTEFDVEVKAHGKTKEDANTLRLEELYNQHKDIVAEILVKSRNYEEHRKEVLQSIRGLNITESDIDRYVLGNYTNDDDMANRLCLIN